MKFNCVCTVIVTLLILAACGLMLADACLGAEWFLLQKVDQSPPPALLADPDLDGTSIRVRWSTLEPSAGRYSWNYLDRQVAAAKRVNKPYMIRVMAGGSTPRHAYSSTTSGIPTPWDGRMKVRFAALMKAMAARYPTPYAIHVPGFDESAEMHLPKRFGHEWQMVEAWQSRLDAVVDAYGDRTLIVLNHSPEPFSPEVRDYLWATVPRPVIQMNALKASTNTSWDGYTVIVDAGQDGRTTGWQFVGPSVNRQRFGGTFQKAVQLGQRSDPLYYEVYQPDVPLIGK